MFAFFNRSRRHVAVLAALAMLASVLVAAPAVAADDPPKASYTATFSACDDAPESSFTDVPSGHANAGDIDCIAYYGITQGTSETTYSPLMSVSREHMALFLTRLAGKVGIEVTSTPDDPGFTDTGDLSEKSQTAIAQLADLGITQGTSETTYSPGAAVRRDHMALFISKLMNLMDPMTDGDDDDGDYGYTPTDVVDNDQDEDIGTPFSDLGPTTKTAYDAITQLYELGVASGISNTAYGPSALITRASMAEFMAAVLDHSNARPAGLSIQASPATAFGGVIDGSVVVSVRDDSFAAVADQAVDIFSSESGALDEDGACKTGADTAPIGDCTWNDNDEFTDGDGNIIMTGAATEGETNVYYAWIGEEDADEFDSDDVAYVSASVTSSTAEQSLTASTSLADQTINNQADLDRVNSVTLTVQLTDGEADTETPSNGTGGPVARSGVEIKVGINIGGGIINNSAATLTTDEDGKVTYVVNAPDDDDDDNDVHAGTDDQGQTIEEADLEDRTDMITFSYVKGGSDNIATDASVIVTIEWTEDNSITTSSTGTAPVYVVPDKDNDVSITATMTLYDQFGRGFREAAGHMVGITIGAAGTSNVNRNGSATRRVVLGDDDGETVEVGAPITVTYVAEPSDPDNKVTEITGEGNDQAPKMVQVVTNADDEDTGPVTVDNLLGDDDEFLASPDGTTTTGSDLVYSYDESDIFINGVGDMEDSGESISLEKFEEILGSKLQAADTEITTPAVVNVVAYKLGGVSIFQVTTAAAGAG